jgi:uncharacterized protein (TIGR00299 family) protein
MNYALLGGIMLYFDCFSGISGDMALGALLDLGVEREYLLAELKKLNLTGYELRVSKKSSYGLTGTDVEVVLTDHHKHHHSHAHQEKEHQHGRNLADIEKLLAVSGLSQWVRESSLEVFRVIAVAEGKVHGKPVEEVHFHEVGAVDSIVDIVGTAICLEYLGKPALHASPLHEGRGFIQCAHGRLPVPVPAVMAMLAESSTPIPLITEEVNTEMVTPTGLGLLIGLGASFGSLPPMEIERVGYGLGKRDTGRFNALRVVFSKFEVRGSRFDLGKGVYLEEIVMLETTIDDMSGEMAGYLTERLLEKGALEVFYTPVYMKKNRPGMLLTVLTSKEQEKELVNLMFKESPTLGLRRSVTERYCLERWSEEVDIGIGKVRVKVAVIDGLRKVAPEFEDCRKIAIKKGLPLWQVYLECIMHNS